MSNKHKITEIIKTISYYILHIALLTG